MNPQDEIETDPFVIRRMSATERSAWQARIIREARAARNAALSCTLVQFATAMLRGARALVSAFRKAFALRDTTTAAPQQRRPRGPIYRHQ